MSDLKILLEDEKPIKVGQVKKTGSLSLVSVDDQIDSILLKLQLGAVQNIDDADTINESLHNKSLLVLLNEEDEENIASSQDLADTKPADSESVKINVDSFAKHVKEFINMAENRLDISSVIVNRARNLIGDKHGNEAKSKFDKALELVGLAEDPRYSEVEETPAQPGAIGGGGA